MNERKKMWTASHHAYLSVGVAARNWFTTIEVSSAITFPVEYSNTTAAWIHNSLNLPLDINYFSVTSTQITLD